MGEPLVLRNDENGVATLTLNRPDKLNALNPALFVEFRSHVDAIADDETVGCVIVTGAGRSFCAGHDLALSQPTSTLRRSILNRRPLTPLNNSPSQRLRRFVVIVSRVVLNSLWLATFWLLLSQQNWVILMASGVWFLFGG